MGSRKRKCMAGRRAMYPGYHDTHPIIESNLFIFYLMY
jgi:hypothetical protein